MSESANPHQSFNTESPSIVGDIEVIDKLPFNVESQVPAAVEVRHIVDAIPSQSELEQGSSYEGEDGEFTDAARLIHEVERFDPHHKLADETLRAEVIGYISPTMFKNVLVRINENLYPDNKGESLAAEAVTLGVGKADERTVGFIGADPSDTDELLEGVLEGMKYFASKGDLDKAGLFAMNGLIPIQAMKDGNKRTARAAYELIAFGYDGSHYDQSALRARLAYTIKARNSANYTVARDYIQPFLQEDMSPSDRKAFYSFDNDTIGMLKRTDLRNQLSGVDDLDMKERLINVLQQSHFGSKYIFESLSPSRRQAIEDSKATFNNTEARKAIVKEGVAEFCGSLDTAQALSLIERDRKIRKEYLLRVMDSTTGKRPLPARYDTMTGDPLGKNASIIEY